MYMLIVCCRDTDMDGETLGFEVWGYRPGGNNLQAGSRRSPPDDAGETRRRTRPRHGSMRTSPLSVNNGASSSNSSNSRPNSMTGMPTPSSTAPSFVGAAQQQQSSVRERSFPPNLQHLWHNENLSDGFVRRSLTPRAARQYSSIYGQHHPGRYQGFHHPSSSSSSNSSNRHPPTGSTSAAPFPGATAIPFDAPYLHGSPPAPTGLDQTSSYQTAPLMGGAHQDTDQMGSPLGNSGSPGEAGPRFPGQSPIDAMRRAFDPQLPPIGADGTIGAFPSMVGPSGSRPPY